MKPSTKPTDRMSIRLDVPFHVENDVLYVEVPRPIEGLQPEFKTIQEAYGFTYREMEDVVCFANQLALSKYLASKLEL
jgi:hypothetical protein